jgi:hypothetical protein
MNFAAPSQACSNPCARCTVTADEKMYRVVSDRARWFEVVMGERYSVDEASTEKLARRIPFPAFAADELMFDLSVQE